MEVKSFSPPNLKRIGYPKNTIYMTLNFSTKQIEESYRDRMVFGRKQGKLSQRKEDIEMFEKMIDEWSKEQITRPSPLTFDIEDLKQKLKEMK